MMEKILHNFPKLRPEDQGKRMVREGSRNVRGSP